MSNLSKHFSAVVSRSYETKDGSIVTFSVGTPYAAENKHGNYKCEYLLNLGTRRVVRTVEGMDGLHAFLLCLSSIRRWLTEADMVDPLLFRWEGADEWGDLGIYLPD